MYCNDFYPRRRYFYLRPVGGIGPRQARDIAGDCQKFLTRISTTFPSLAGRKRGSVAILAARESSRNGLTEPAISRASTRSDPPRAEGKNVRPPYGRRGEISRRDRRAALLAKEQKMGRIIPRRMDSLWRLRIRRLHDAPRSCKARCV